MKKKKFSISRINTKIGIFKITGIMEKKKNILSIKISTLQIMSTDGWCSLDLESGKNEELIKSIELEVIEHIKIKNHEE
ncbi:hypothetical protein MRO13_09375 [Vibrio metschnikovii]|uniref:hypothetical protein n=1 Tax=Vibrio metschnikovii TaxID=28172 RepID=UPI00332F78F0